MPPEDETGLQQFEPVIVAITAACTTTAPAPAELTQFLAQLAADADWAALAAVLRRILAGERAGTLLDGLDPTGTAITRGILTRLAAASPAS